MSPQMSVKDAVQHKAEHGFSGFPVTANGEIGAQLIGLVTGRDFDFLSTDEHDKPISEVQLASFYMLGQFVFVRPRACPP